MSTIETQAAEDAVRKQRRRNFSPGKIAAWAVMIAFLIVSLFPFYWMAITTFKPNEELLSREGNPFWIIEPTLAHVKKLLFDTAYPQWMWNTVLVSVVATFFSLAASVCCATAAVGNNKAAIRAAVKRFLRTVFIGSPRAYASGCASSCSRDGL